MLHKKILIYLVGLIFTYLIYVFPYDALTYLIFSEKLFQISSFFFSLILYLIIIISSKSQNSFFPVKILIYEGMGIGFISFWVVCLFLIINYFFEIDSVSIGFISCICILLLVIISLFQGRQIKLKKVKINSKKIKKKYKFMFISDVHLGSNSKNHLRKLLSKIKKHNFDILLIGGDLIDSSNFDTKSLELIKDIKKPILFVTGNHELYLKNWKLISKSLIDYNIKNIDNISYKYREINFLGIGDGLSTEQQVMHVKKNYQKNFFNIALIHKPTLSQKTSVDTDLILSGHTHNGQIFPFNLIVWLKYKNMYGLFKKNELFYYITSGAGCWGPKMRLGSQNEIVLISISNKI